MRDARFASSWAAHLVDVDQSSSDRVFSKGHGDRICHHGKGAGAKE